MQVVWLDVDDTPGPESERAYLERNAIGLLSRLGLLGSGSEPDWLGRFSSDWRIAISGLWNLNHLFYKPDVDFMERLTAAVERTIGHTVRAIGAERPNKAAGSQLSLLLGKGEQ